MLVWRQHSVVTSLSEKALRWSFQCSWYVSIWRQVLHETWWSYGMLVWRDHFSQFVLPLPSDAFQQPSLGNCHCFSSKCQPAQGYKNPQLKVGHKFKIRTPLCTFSCSTCLSWIYLICFLVFLSLNAVLSWLSIYVEMVLYILYEIKCNLFIARIATTASSTNLYPCNSIMVYLKISSK